MRLALFLLTLSAFTLNAATINVAQSGTVTAQTGTFSGAALDTVIDNTFLTEGSEDGAVTWGNKLNVVQLDLTGVFNIVGIVLQAGGNDAYRLDFLNTATNSWDTLWNVSACTGCGGAYTRTEWVLATVAAQSFRFFVNPGTAGTGSYSLSEVQLFANVGDANDFTTFTVETPEPGTMSLLGVAMAALALGARRTRK